VVIARSFNHSGPRQNDNFVIPSFAKQIAAIEAGRRQPVINIGDLSARRDLSDVRDIVHGYRLLAEKGRPGEVYHFCCGKAVAIKSILDSLLKLTSRPIKAKTDKRLLRKTDIPVLRGSNRRIVKELGYKTRYTLKDTLSDTLNYWREKTKARTQ
jgi:GDP-4-dehydro-6-deoxy-D-mannose reductase